jgi:hypothetical protein
MGRPAKFTDRNKEWFNRRSGCCQRPLPTRQERERFLIVCEGEKTEPNYFEAFGKELPPHMVELKVKGAGANTLSLVSIAQEIRETLEKQRRDQPFDQVWVVFDRDSFPPDDFDNAIKKAKALGMQAAWSNEAFELWYILHFEFSDTATSRNDYKGKLTNLLREPYKKNDPEMYIKLAERGNQAQAIAWAKRLHFVVHTNTASSVANPCTTVYELVEKLNSFKEKKRD